MGSASGGGAGTTPNLAWSPMNLPGNDRPSGNLATLTTVGGATLTAPPSPVVSHPALVQSGEDSGRIGPDASERRR
jgi:hypothetical protein